MPRKIPSKDGDYCISVSFSGAEGRPATACLGTTLGGEAVLTHVLAVLS